MALMMNARPQSVCFNIPQCVLAMSEVEWGRSEMTPSGHRCDVSLLSSEQQQTVEAALTQNSVAVLVVVAECAILKPRPKEVAVDSMNVQLDDSDVEQESESDATPPLYASSESSDEMIPTTRRHDPLVDDESSCAALSRARWEFRNKDLIWLIEKLAINGDVPY